jgi:hypothetical protein
VQHIATALFCAFFAAVSVAIVAGEGASPTISFVRDVAPIVVANCQACHGSKGVESNYRVDSFSALMQAGDHGAPPVVAGNVDESELYRLITSEDADERMPNNGDRLADAEIQTIAAWLTQGAQFDGQDAKAPLTTQIPRDLPNPAAPQTYPAAMPVTALALTADGTRLISGGYHELLIWDAATGALRDRVGDVPQRTFGLAFNGDGTLLAVAGGSPGISGEVRLIPWGDALRPDAKPAILAKHEDVFFDVAFRPDDQQLVAAAADGTIRVFDVASGNERVKIEAHADWATAVSYSDDGAALASASRDKTAKVFNAESGALLTAYSEHEAPVRAIAFAADGKSVLSAGGGAVHIWNVEDAKRLGEIRGFAGDVDVLAVRGATAVAASTGGSIRHFRVADRELIREFNHRSQAILSLAWRQPPDRIWLGGLDGTAALWDLDAGKILKEFPASPRDGEPSH